MSILVVGVNHRSADVALLERVAVPADDIGKAVRALASMDHVLEAVVLSTCNRVEVYAHVSRFHPGSLEIQGWLATRGDLDPMTLSTAQYTHYDDRAIAHLFAVSSGLDSMVVGERQIAMQVRHAAALARDEGTTGRLLHELFTRAQHASRRVRSETDISRGASSMVDVGFDVARRRWGGSLSGRTAAVLGAGTMGSLAATRLAAEVPARAMYWNRDPARARRLAARVGGEHVAGGVVDAISDADLVICCTGASMPIVDAEMVADVMARRPDRPLVLIDLAMPRNVDPVCDAVPGVSVIDLDAIRAVVDTSPDGAVLEEARALVEEEAAKFHLWTQAVKVEPTVRALRQRADEVREIELRRAAARLSELDPREREAVEALTRGIVNRLLHDPTVRLKALADRGGAEHYALALRELFDLDE